MPVAVGLGSNLGDPVAHLAAALAGLARLLSDLRVGPLFRSPPADASQQPDYFNSAVVGDCRLRPEELLAALKRLELARGRRAAPRNAPRPLDLDLLLYGDARLSRPELTLPHPRLEQRSFVLAPLAAVAPDWRVPPSGRSVRQLWLERRDGAGLEPLEWPRELVRSGRLVASGC